MNDNTTEVNNFFFSQFSRNEINSSDFIKLKNDKNIFPKKSEVDNLLKNKIDPLDFNWNHRANPAEDLETAIKEYSITVIGKRNLGKNPNINYPNRTHFKKRKKSLSRSIRKIISILKGLIN